MGAWGPGNFENDVALDFLAGINERVVVAQLRAIDELEEDDDLDASEASMGLVAAEMVAAGLGRPSAELRDATKEELEVLTEEAWIPRLSAERERAARVVRRIATASELADLWGETEDGLGDWAAALDDLLVRLGEDGL